MYITYQQELLYQLKRPGQIILFIEQLISILDMMANTSFVPEDSKCGCLVLYYWHLL